MVIHSDDLPLRTNHTTICSVLSCVVSGKIHIWILFWREKCFNRQLQQSYVAVAFFFIKISEVVVVVVSINSMFSKLFFSVSPGNV